MKLRVFCLIVLTAAIAFPCTAQEGSRRARKAVQKVAQARLDSLNRIKALNAILDDHWAFESTRVTGANGESLDIGATPRTNIAGFDGIRFAGEIMVAGNNAVFVRSIFSNAKMVQSGTTKKGNFFKYISQAPTRSESTLTLSKSSDFATLYITMDGVSANYSGRVMPMFECQYFMRLEHGLQPRKSVSKP